MEYIPINFAIIGHPINWLTVWLMVAIAAFAVNELINFFNSQSSENQ
jgi:hypothetical protein